MAANTSTKKSYNSVKEPLANKSLPLKSVRVGILKGEYAGQVAGDSQKYAEPMNRGIVAAVGGIAGLHNDIGEMSGFITDGYIDKQGTPFGEAAKFNYLPPGMDISNQMNAEIHEMPLRQLVSESYPGDGWMPKPRDVVE